MSNAKNLAWYAAGPDGKPIGIGERVHLAIKDAEDRGNHEPHDWAPDCYPLRTHDEVRKVRANLDSN